MVSRAGLTDGIGTAFAVKSCRDTFNVYFSYAVARKLRLNVPQMRLLQRGNYEYASFQKSVERVARTDDAIQPLVYFPRRIRTS